MADDAQYEYKSVQAIRGTEAKTIAKWQKDGWEIDTRSQGLLRTEMTFRRVKPKTLGSSVLAAFRRLEPKVQGSLLAVSGGLILIGVIIGVVALAQGGAGTSEPIASSTETEAEPSEESSEDSAPEPEAAESAPAPTPSTAPEVLTVENNEDLAALVAITDPGVAAVGEFAAKYRGRAIEFDGNIAYMNNHGDYTTRYDILIGTGDYSETAKFGPNFKFEDVNTTYDLHLTGSNIPDTIGMGDNLRVVARVVEYNSTQQLFFLEPISTEVR